MTTYSLHPGVVQTDLWRHLNGPQQFVMKMVSPFTKNSVQGAQTTIYCAVEPSLENQTGGYYRYNKHKRPSLTFPINKNDIKCFSLSDERLFTFGQHASRVI